MAIARRVATRRVETRRVATTDLPVAPDTTSQPRKGLADVGSIMAAMAGARPGAGFPAGVSRGLDEQSGRR